MAPSPLDSSRWAANNQKAGAFSKYDIEQGTKMWHEKLQPPNGSQTNQATSHPQVLGGLPPHLLRQRQDTNAPPQASTILAPAACIKPPDLEENVRAQHMLTPQTRDNSLQSRPQATPSHDASLGVDLKQVYPPTPAYRETTKMVPLTKANSSMHPLLQKIVGNRFSVAVKQDPYPDPREGGAHHSPTNADLEKGQCTQAKDGTPKTQGCSQNKKWRPKHSEDLESQSLPSTAASVNFSNCDGSDFPDRSEDGKGAFIKDVRGNIADELETVSEGNGNGRANKNVWKDHHSDTPSNGDADNGFFVTGWKSSYCSKWVAGLSKTPPAAAFCLEKNIDRHWECDIDPKDGFLMSPIEYPPTAINPQDPGKGQELERRLRDTAAMRATLGYPQLQKRVENREKTEEVFYALNTPSHFVRKSRSPSPAPQPSPVADLNLVTEPFVPSVQQLSQGNVAPTHDLAGPTQQASQNDVDGRQVNISCHIRPAEMADASQVLEIYNWEVINGCQALDAKPLALQDIQRVLKDCMSANMPFIVVVQGPPMEAASRRGVSAHPRGPYKQHRPIGPYKKAPKPQSTSDKILGFGFISCPMVGLAGNVHTNVGRFIGRVHFYVDHASRRKGIGRAILHKLTRCCSKSYHSVDWYKWYDPVGAAVFKEPDYNPRNYSRLYIESSSTGEKDPDNAWREKFMGDMGYMFMSTLDKTRKLGHGQDGEWRDTIVWQHDCREPKSSHEFD